MTIFKQLHALRTGETDLAAHLETLCRHIEAEENSLHALVGDTFDPSGITAEASRLLDRYPEPENRPPLFGLPIGVKDIIRVDGMPTRAGSQLPPELFAGPQATCVTRLFEAGAIVIAKTVTAEFAGFTPGPTVNPHNPRHTPGGSSSGSAAGVAKGYFPVALGTQTVGSVIRPAAYCGVVGFKPTFERIPVDGIIPVATSLDHAGFFCRDISGLAAVAPVLVDDWKPTPKPDAPLIAIPEGPYLQLTSADALRHFNATLDHLREKGFRLEPRPALEDIDAIKTCHTRIMMAEMAHTHAQWYPQNKNLYSPRTAKAIETGQGIDDAELHDLLAEKTANREKINLQMQRDGIDFWIAPSATGHAPEGLDSTGDPAMNLPWTHFGFPAVSIPSGLDRDKKLPLGLQLIGPYGRDESLVSLAESISAALA